MDHWNGVNWIAAAMSLSDIRLMRNAGISYARTFRFSSREILPWMRTGQKAGVTNDMSVTMIKNTNGQLINITIDLPLLDPHIILDRFHTADTACDFDCLVDIGLRADEATQLNDTFESFNIDFCGFQGGLVKNCRFDLRGENSIIKILSGS